MTGPVLSRAERELLERFRFGRSIAVAEVAKLPILLRNNGALALRITPTNRKFAWVETTAAGRALLDGGVG